MATRIKPRSNSVGASLTAEQRVIVDKMLFEQNLSYTGISKMSVAKIGVFLSKDSLRRYYKDVAQQRTLDRIINGAKSANAVVKAFTDSPADTYQAILKVVGQIAFEKAIDSNEQLDIRTIRELTSLLISARREDIQARRFSLDREKWEFDVVRACQQHHAELQAISADKSLDEDARLLAIQRRLFGTNLPV
jgi:hypothetical protein